MKKNILTWIMILISIAICKGQSDNLKTNYKTKWTIKEVKTFAKQYNLQDSISERKNTALLNWERIKIEKWCQDWERAINERNAILAYFKDTEKVHSRVEHFKLLDSHPIIRKKIADSYGGEEGFNKFKAKSLKSNWRIYRNIKGELAFRPASIPISQEEVSFGKRVDNLPKD